MSNDVKDPTPVFVTVSGENVAEGVAVSSTTTYTSRVTSPSRDKIVTYMFKMVGGGAGATGTLTVEVSNSSRLKFARGTEEWDTYAPTGFVIPAISVGAGATQRVFIELVDFGPAKVRLKYVNATNGGTITADVAVA
jgi:hypothetical protein